MDVREKLVEFQSIITCPNAICNFCEHFKTKGACEKHIKEVIADNMIAHGVTVQECGRWEYHDSVCTGEGLAAVYACSKCHFCIDEEAFEQLYSTNYCPHCGAKMDKEGKQMIISKKKFEEEISKARNEEIRRLEEMKMREDENRWRNERIDRIEQRLNTAFPDIDRRLTELEKRERQDIPVCPRY